MSDREFRFIIITEKYEETVAFYRDGLGLTVKETWEKGASNRATLFEASSGIIEVVATPLFSDPAGELLTAGLPRGTTIGIEVGDVGVWYEKIRAKHLHLRKGLSDLPWGHRGFSISDPNEMAVYIFSKSQKESLSP
ncbi:MAG: VOC family protein [Nitrososphaerales archaeon]